MKAILISIRPQWVVKILNGEKTIEVRKHFPKDYVGWVYIYVTKGNKNECLIADLQPDKVYHQLTEKMYRGVYSIVEENAIWNDCKKYIINGKVVARFWCNKVEEISNFACFYNTKNISSTQLEILSCLTFKELNDYLKGKNGYAIHITNLEIFDTPKELKNFLVYSHTVDGIGFKGEPKSFQILKPLIKAPQSWRYIEE